MLKFFLRNLLTSIVSIFIFLLIMFYGINILIPGDFLTPLRLMMSQEELDALRETLGASDPLIQQYYRWIQSVFSGEITPGGFRQRSSKTVLDTVLPTLHILLPSFIISIYLSRIPALKTKVKRLGKEKIFSDVFGILLISLFPPIIYFLISERLENIFRSLFEKFEITGTSSEILLFSEIKLGLGYLIFAIACSFIIVSFFEIITMITIPKQKILLATGLLLLVLLFFETKEIVTMLYYSKNAFITIGILTILLIGEFILFNNIIVQNISKEDHIMTAAAIGYSNQKIFKDHIIRNSFFPFATRIAINLPYTVASLVIVESTTGWGGMGSMLYRAIMSQDSNAAMAILFLLAILTATLRLIITFSQVIFNPQLRGTQNV
ncbi:MAG: ABC transporter permease [Actinobacteria bacterium]|nr:ABC transporter permease [Actinomycetota bacterium]MBT5655307.1 ABC transporter permease [Actinomycetota bacterium]MBT7013408.1 ABC transporter permease [Actinomycetota bacterium]